MFRFPLHTNQLYVRKRQLYVHNAVSHGCESSLSTNYVNRACFDSWTLSFAYSKRETTSRAVQFVLLAVHTKHMGRERYIFVGAVSTKIWMNWRIGMGCVRQWVGSIAFSLNVFTHLTLTHIFWWFAHDSGKIPKHTHWTLSSVDVQCYCSPKTIFIFS